MSDDDELQELTQQFLAIAREDPNIRLVEMTVQELQEKGSLDHIDLPEEELEAITLQLLKDGVFRKH